MKRKYKETQKQIDNALQGAIEEGETSNAVLGQVIKDLWASFNVGDLVDLLVRVELSAGKQRLRNAGVIEITRDNVPILVTDISQDDAEFIDQRRRAHIQGELRTRVAFNTRHARPEAAQEASRQLTMFESPEEVPNEAPVSI